MNKPIAVLLLVSLIGWCVLHAMQETSGGVRGGRWSNVTFMPTRRTQQQAEGVTGESTADRRRARDAAKEEARAAKEKEATQKDVEVASGGTTGEQPQEETPIE